MYKSLQCGRAAAALLVVFFHLGGAFRSEKYFAQPWLDVPFADAGVQFFFVLSGFIIFSVHRKDVGRPARVLGYLRKRAVRIYPIYWVIFLAVFFSALAIPGLRETVPHDLPTILKSLLLVPQDPAVVGGTGAPVLIVAWSLQFEILFYLAFAAAILNRWLGIGIALFFLILYSLPLAPLPFPASLLQSRLPLLFLAGIGAAFAARIGGRGPWPAVMALGGCLGFIALAVTESVVGVSPALQDFGYGLASAGIVGGFVKLEDAGTVIGDHPFVQLLGAASYTLYLIHYPLISFLCKVAMALGLKGLGGVIFSYFAILGACLVAAIGVHLCVERPLLKYLSVAKRSPLPA